MKIFLSAGEVSGDLLAAGLVRELRALVPDAEIYGVGSHRLAAAGMDVRHDISATASIGVVEALRHLPRALFLFPGLKRLLAEERPDLFVAVDCQGINLVLARQARALGIPVVYYVPPQNYVWGDVKRGRQIAARTDLFLNIYRSGHDFYRGLGAKSVFLGHPLLDIVHGREKEAVFRRRWVLPDKRRFVGIVPGARGHEMQTLLPLFIEAAEALHHHDHDLFFLFPAADRAHKTALERALAATHFPWRVIEDDIHNLAAVSSAVITKSGTSALDVAAMGTPYVVAYRLNRLSYFIFARLWGLARRIRWVSLPNLLVDGEVARELLQDAATVENIVEETRHLLDDRPYAAARKRGLADFKRLLGERGAARRGALEIVKFLRAAAKKRDR